MKVKLVFLLFLLLWGIHSLLFSSEIEVTASVTAREMGLADLLMYTVSFKGITQPSKLDLSDFKDFKIIEQYTGSSFKMINGRSSYYINFNYYLKPLKEGVLTIPSVTYEYDGKIYKTREFKIKVEKGKSSSLQRSQTNRKRNPFFDDDFFKNDSFFNRRSSKEEIDVQIEPFVSKKNAYVGEQILFKVFLITRNTISSVNLLSSPSFEGFWNEDFPSPSVISGTSRIINNKNYQVYVIKKVALFPSGTGELVIPPLEFEMKLSLRGLSVFKEERRIIRKTNKTTINVKPLPNGYQDLPVGKFMMKVDIPTRSIDIKDILTIQASLSGNGNLKIAKLPEIKSSTYFKVYPAKFQNESRFQQSKIIAGVKIEFPITFLKTGLFPLGTLQFRYFDPELNRIINQKKDLGSINIIGTVETLTKKPGEDVKQTLIRKEGEDIAFILKGNVYSQKDGFYKKSAFIFLLILPFFLNFLYLLKILLTENLIKKNEKFRNKKNLNESLLKLRSVKSYQDISPILELYLNKKLNLGFSSMSNLQIDKTLSDKGVREFDINHFMKIKSRSDSARFSPEEKEGEKLNKDLDLLNNILKRIDRALR